MKRDDMWRQLALQRAVPEPPTLPMPKWTKVFDGATGEWEIQYG